MKYFWLKFILFTYKKSAFRKDYFILNTIWPFFVRFCPPRYLLYNFWKFKLKFREVCFILNSIILLLELSQVM